jgi:arsenite-transporting ATPase
VIDLVESGKYDTIVFDTAPTGHTLKLLQLPQVMQAGLEKLESWQASIWGYWEMVKGQGQAVDVKKEVANRIRQYKHGIERVGKMLKDGKRTKFVVVCIAEFLSISESRRLLQELARHEVSANNVVVNQLVNEVLSQDELVQLNSIIGESNPALLDRVSAVSALTNARYEIQQKYLRVLRGSPEAEGMRIVEVPLLPSEITGPANLLEFSQFLIPKGYRASPTDSPKLLANRDTRPNVLYERSVDMGFIEGEKVELRDLHKSPQYNGKIAEVVKVSEDGRVVIRVRDPEGTKFKILSLRPENLEVIKQSERFL